MTALSGDPIDRTPRADRSVLQREPASNDDHIAWSPGADCRYRGARLVAKRLIDLAVAGPALVITAPLLAAIALGVRLTSTGPAIYRQTRIGQNGKRFTIFKYRTMHRDADRRLRDDPDLWSRYLDGGFKLSLAEDPRLTRVGAMLRKTSLDELPQLLNVVKGDMSLVGPRPVIPEELEQYGIHLDAYLMAVPGLTGAWQVAGRDAVRFPGRAHLDADYIEHWSLRRDLAIIVRTLPAALLARHVR